MTAAPPRRFESEDYTPAPIEPPSDGSLLERVTRVEIILSSLVSALGRIEKHLAEGLTRPSHAELHDVHMKLHHPKREPPRYWLMYILQITVLAAAIVVGYMSFHGMEIRNAARPDAPTVVNTPSPPATVVIEHRYPQAPDAGASRRRPRPR